MTSAEQDAARAAQGQPHYAVVDIGSNSVRLVVYDQLSRSPLPRFNEKSLCRLGEDLAQSGSISSEAFRRTVVAVRRFRAVADAMEVGCIDAVATEAMRRASNGPDLVEAIKRESGLDVRILSGAEEARFAALGVIAGFHEPRGIVGDMGGGSLEMAMIGDGSIETDTISLPIGALPVLALIEQAGSDAKRAIDGRLRDTCPDDWAPSVFYAVGGGWRALARVHMAATDAPLRVVHGYKVEARELRSFAKSIQRMPEQKISSLPGLPSRRGGTLPSAALVMDRVIKRLAPDHVVFSALGVREGWLYHRLPPADQALDPLLVGAETVGRLFARVPSFADALVRWTDGLLAGETGEERRLRLAACALSDIGWRDDASVRAAESFRRLINAPFIGVDHAERAYIAAMVHARYAGGAGDSAVLSPAISLLTAEERRRALVLGRALLLGYRLSGSVPDILDGAKLKILDGGIRLEVSKAVRVPDSEVVTNRLNLVAAAAGVRRTEVVELA